MIDYWDITIKELRIVTQLKSLKIPQNRVQIRAPYLKFLLKWQNPHFLETLTLPSDSLIAIAEIVSRLRRTTLLPQKLLYAIA